MRRILSLLAVAVAVVWVLEILVVASVWAPPLFSGALFLLWPARTHAVARTPAMAYEPLHQGHVDLATGLSQTLYTPTAQGLEKKIAERIAYYSKPDPLSGCHIWHGLLKDGYGCLHYQNQTFFAHRLAQG